MQEAQVKLRYVGNRKLGHVKYVGDGIHCFLEYPSSCDVVVSEEKANQLLRDFPDEWLYHTIAVRLPPTLEVPKEDAFISRIRGDMHVTKKELVRWAKGNLNLSLSMGLTKAQIRDKILEAV